MKLLLDTQTWIWGILEPSRLTSRAAAQLDNPANELWLSPVSVWEVLVLARKKRLVLQPNAEEWIRHWLRERPMLEAPMSREVALQSERLFLPHQDPADRFIAATAVVYGLTLVTSDERLLKCKDVRTLASG